MQVRRGVAGVVVALVTGLVSGSAVAGTHDVNGIGIGIGLRPPGTERLLPSGARDRVPLPGVRRRGAVPRGRHGHPSSQDHPGRAHHGRARRPAPRSTAPSRSARTTGTPPTSSATSGTSESRPPPTTGVASSRTGRAPGSPVSAVDGAGIIMPASPHPTNAYRQEFDRGAAEDQAWIVQRHVRVTVPFGVVHEGLRSFEWSRLEPNVLSAKITPLASASSASVTCRAGTRGSIWSRSRVARSRSRGSARRADGRGGHQPLAWVRTGPGTSSDRGEAVSWCIVAATSRPSTRAGPPGRSPAARPCRRTRWSRRRRCAARRGDRHRHQQAGGEQGEERDEPPHLSGCRRG